MTLHDFDSMFWAIEGMVAAMAIVLFFEGGRLRNPSVLVLASSVAFIVLIAMLIFKDQIIAH